MEVLHFKRKLWLKDWFPSVPNGLVVTGAHYLEHPYQLYPWVNPVGYLFILVMKKRLHLTYILIGHTWALSNRKTKTVEGAQVLETALPENITWTANGEHDRWSLVTDPLQSHTYSETNIDTNVMVSRVNRLPRYIQSFLYFHPRS